MTTITELPAAIVDCSGTCKRPVAYHVVTKLGDLYGCDCPAAARGKDSCRHVRAWKVKRGELADFDVIPFPDRSHLPFPNCKELCGIAPALWSDDDTSNEGHSNTCPNLGNPERALPRMAEVTT